MSVGDTTLILVLVCLLLSAFFSSSEAAFLSLQRTRIAHLVTTGRKGSRRVSRMIEEPERLLSTILLGNNLVNVAFASLITVTTVSLLGEGRGVVVATALATAVLLVFGEVLPKTFAVRHAERTAFLYARPLKWIEFLLLPMVLILRYITRVSTLGRRSTKETVSITEGELRTMIDIGEAEGTFEASEAEMLGNVFRFGDRQVREVMTPRTEIVFIERGATIEEFLSIWADHTHTRFPVFKESTDNIVGILSAKDILKVMASGEISKDMSVTDVIRDAHFVPETKRISELFEELRKSGNQMAIAVDEFGGVAGLVTLKRLLEEVVGRVGEEGTGPEEEYEAIDENTFQVEGGMAIDEINQELGVNLPEGEFETVAGFVLDVLGRIPDEGEQFEYGDLKLEVTQMKDLKIETIKVTKEANIQKRPAG